jgi:hypothetical protein
MNGGYAIAAVLLFGIIVAAWMGRFGYEWADGGIIVSDRWLHVAEGCQQRRCLRIYPLQNSN